MSWINESAKQDGRVDVSSLGALYKEDVMVPSDFKKLIKEKIKADVSLEAELIDSPYGIEYYLWIPVKDTHSPTQKQLEIGVNFIANLVKDKIKVFVHCQRGHGRSPTLVAAYLISKGKSVDEAIEIIKKKRPAIHPNKFQMNALKKFEEKQK